MSIGSTAFFSRSFEPLASVTHSPPATPGADPAVTALHAVSDVAAEATAATHSAAKDIILFWGPGHDQQHLNEIVSTCSKLGVALKVVAVGGLNSLRNSLKMDLYLGGELGQRTQVIATFHGGTNAPGGGHYLQLSADNKERMVSRDFFSWLRSPPPGMPASPAPAGWKGTVHAFWCGSGKLRDDCLPGDPVWSGGTVMSYSSRKDTASHNAVKSILDLCQYVGEARDDPSLLAPQPVAARMLGVVGDTFCCMGNGFEQAIVIGAPRTAEEAQPGYLIDCLNGRAGQQMRVTGAARDLRAIAVSMRQPRARSHDPERCKTKLENVFVTRYARDKLAAMDTLLQQHEFLSSLRLSDGSSVSDMREQVRAILDLREAVKGLRAGRRDTGLLTTALEQKWVLERHGEDFEIDLEGLVSGCPDLVMEGLRWAVTHGDATLFFELLALRAGSVDEQFTHEFLPLALKNCAPVAMELLAVTHVGATITDRIVEGIRQGASGPVLATWLLDHHWCTDTHAVKTVLHLLQEKGHLASILRVLAAYAPEILDKALAVMATQRQRFANEVAMLLAFASSTSNVDLYFQVRQHFSAFVKT